MRPGASRLKLSGAYVPPGARTSRSPKAAALGLCLPLCLAATSGCYSTRATSPEPLRTLRTKPPAEDAGLLDGLRLDPSSRLRLQRTDGTWTPWVKARHLHLSDDGLFVGVRPVPWEDIATAEVLGASAGLEEALFSLPKPPGARVDATARGILLQAGTRSLAAWLATLPESPGAQWRLRTRQRQPLPMVSDEELRASLGGALQVADGVRFADVSQVELNNFNGGITYLTLLWAFGTSVVGGPLWTVLGAPAGARAPPTLEVTKDAGRIFSAANVPPPRPEAPRPLFTDGAVRRSRVRLLAFAGAGAEPSLALTNATLRAGVGARFVDVFEVALLAQPQWPAPLSTGGLLPGDPLAPGAPAHEPQWFGGVRVGLHLEVDAPRRLALPLALEAGRGPHAQTLARFRFGVRLRPLEATNLWLGLHPFNPTRTRGTGWTFPTSLELMYDL